MLPPLFCRLWRNGGHRSIEETEIFHLRYSAWFLEVHFYTVKGQRSRLEHCRLGIFWGAWSRGDTARSRTGKPSRWKFLQISPLRKPTFCTLYFPPPKYFVLQKTFVTPMGNFQCVRPAPCSPTMPIWAIIENLFSQRNSD